ncbi:MAG: hypothetical protein AB1633_02275 [Elusimicrobiota bacterium]
MARLIPLLIFSTAFGYIEAAVVVYLREIFYPGGFSFPLKPFSPGLLVTEIVREAATIILLACAAFISAKRISERISFFLFCFAVWDITYYLWLKVLLNWPASIFEWDILFLIPVPWTSPVFAPVIVSLTLILWAILILRLGTNMEKLKFSLLNIFLVVISSLIIFLTFIWNLPEVVGGAIPKNYPWLLFAFGVFISFLAILNFARENK